VLKRVLLRPRNAGLLEHHEAGRVRATWPAIFSEQEWQRLTAVLSDPSRSKRRGAPRRYLLSGILRCGECGRRMVSGPAPQGRTRTYICMPRPYGCNRVSIVANWVEEFVTDAVLGVLGDPTVSGAGDSNNGNAAQLDSIAADRLLLDELAAAYAGRKITMSEWLTARTPIEARISAEQTSIADDTRTSMVRRLTARSVGLREVWPTLDVEKQRAILETVLDHIVVRRVGKGSYRESSRLNPVWRH
jgi:site-specific DNA recombinase